MMIARGRLLKNDKHCYDYIDIIKNKSNAFVVVTTKFPNKHKMVVQAKTWESENNILEKFFLEVSENLL